MIEYGERIESTTRWGDFLKSAQIMWERARFVAYHCSFDTIWLIKLTIVSLNNRLKIAMMDTLRSQNAYIY